MHVVYYNSFSKKKSGKATFDGGKLSSDSDSAWANHPKTGMGKNGILE
jgi:hypothetical protein